MAENSNIAWTTHTFNPWRGCAKVAKGCEFCYADAMSGRNPGTLGIWGPNGTRVLASESMWRQPVKWNKEAAYEHARRLGPTERPRVFCASLADVFEDYPHPLVNAKGEQILASCPGDEKVLFTMPHARQRLFSLIDATPHLDWLLLTKRPENILEMWPDCDYGTADCDATDVHVGPKFRSNVWLGTSVATQADADRNIPLLLKCRGLAPVLFVSAEPLIEAINFTRLGEEKGLASPGVDGLDWLIVGGESGPNARPCHIEWIQSIVKQCGEADVACFVKQLGASVAIESFRGIDWPTGTRVDGHTPSRLATVKLRDPKGGDPTEWPSNLRVQQFPRIKT